MTARVETIAENAWAVEVAAAFEQRVQPGMRICLAAGSTPAPVYAEIARNSSLDGVAIFLLDEFGGLPPGDPGRCVSMIRRDLLDRAKGDTAVSVPDVDSTDPDAAAVQYGELIADGGIDLAIVGLGGNGHIGMNEPGSTLDLGTRVVSLDPSTTSNAAEYGATLPPTWGITVGMSELMETREVWLLVTGSHKRDILDRTLHGAVDSDVPATYLTEHPNCTFYIDEPAAGMTAPA